MRRSDQLTTGKTHSTLFAYLEFVQFWKIANFCNCDFAISQPTQFDFWFILQPCCKASDLDFEFINYVQNIHQNGHEPTHDEFYIACRDKANNESAKKRVGVIINPVNDEPPKIEHSRWRVREGDLLNIDTTLLNCIDKERFILDGLT